MAREYGPPEPSTLGGCTLRLKITSIPNERRYLEVIVADRQVGQGGEAHVYSVQPAGSSATSEYRALGIPLGTKLVARFSTRDTAASSRRVSALRSIIDIQRQRPESLLGLVTIYGFGIVDRLDGARVDGGLFFDLMVDAGDPLFEMVALNGAPGPGKRWALAPGETAAAFIPAAKALATLHGITASEDGSLVATAHRDIKPGNALVLWPEERGYNNAVAGYSSDVVPQHGLPLLRFGDLGDVRSLGIEPGSTATRAPGSARWSAPEVYSGIVRNPAAADVWSFGATLFYAATGHYPWTSLEHAGDFDVARFAIETSTSPESPDFDTIPWAMEDLIRRCLLIDPEGRPSMSSVAVELETLVVAEQVFVEADTPTVEVQVPLRPIPYVPDGDSVPSSPTQPPAEQSQPARSNSESPIPLGWLGGIAAAAAVALFLMAAFHLIPVKNFPVDLRPNPSAIANPAVTSPVTAAPVASPAPTTTPTPKPPPPPDPVVGIGPWTVSQYVAAERKPLSDLGWALQWARAAATPGRNVSNAKFKIAPVAKIESILSVPTYLFTLTEIINSSNHPMTFTLGNCGSTPERMRLTGSGPSLIVSGPKQENPHGYSFTDGKGPFAVTPSCDHFIRPWPGSITVGAGKTWKANNNYLMVFEMEPGTAPASYKATGLLMKSTEGDVLFGSVSPKEEATQLMLPAAAAHICGC